MFTTYRMFYKYGSESDYTDMTIKEFSTIEKAINYAHRYAKGIRFCGVQIENDDGKLVYEITSNGDVYDYRREKAR